MIHPVYGCVVALPPRVGVPLHRCAQTWKHVRLDAELWRPPLQWHDRTESHESQDARREYRRRNRPFRRAFVGGEARRNALLKAGLSMAAERARKAAGL